MNAMLLAAGRGERLRPVTDRVPKALVEVRGKSLIERHLDALAACGCRKVVINLGWLGDQIAERVGSGKRYGLDVVYSDEGDDVLETGGGILRALPLLGSEPFVVVNADIYTDMPLPPPMPAPDELGHLVLVPRPAHKPEGDFQLARGKIAVAARPSWTFSGVAAYRPALFEGLQQGRFPLAPLLRAAAERGALGGSIYDGVWEDVGTPERLESLNRLAT